VDQPVRRSPGKPESQHRWRACHAVHASNEQATSLRRNFLILKAQPKLHRDGNSHRRCWRWRRELVRGCRDTAAEINNHSKSTIQIHMRYMYTSKQKLCIMIFFKIGHWNSNTMNTYTQAGRQARTHARTPCGQEKGGLEESALCNRQDRTFLHKHLDQICS
jgi:hypothetical protein